MKKLLLIAVVIVSSLSARGQDTTAIAQTDSERVIQFQNIEKPHRIHFLSMGKKIKLKVVQKNDSYYIKGKVTFITASGFVLNYKYHISFINDSIQKYYFKHHSFGRVILGTVGGVIVFIGVSIAAMAVLFHAPGLAISSIVYFGAIGSVPIILASNKAEHKTDEWRMSLKKKLWK